MGVIEFSYITPEFYTKIEKDEIVCLSKFGW